ncbi:hypothetical protein B296_00023174 [Ensete ventricosum]|uniref:Uncharacterized protein n=1 Tax=Ensete ventricosum TaxID=4639 RepID=A0A426XY41_ENSVE|nr:hypothetical protein B296_00023174 [Ensete ventricosum]
MIYIFFLQLACVKHFSMEPLSFLGIDVCDENEVILYLLLYKAHNRGKDCKNSRDDLGEGLSDLRKLLKAWSSVILNNKIQLLDIFCEATDPALSSLDPSNHKLERELPLSSLIELLDLWSIHTEELYEV